MRFNTSKPFWLILILFLLGTEAWAINDGYDPRYPERVYRRFELPNRMKVLLISDPTITKSAVSLSVAAGSLSNPPDQQGMAHFLEHMLFLGTEKYPKVDAYKQYLADHSGRSNAYTAQDHTNYHFEIGAAHLEKALDMFSQFFIAPLFDPTYVERELNAIDSEHGKNMEDDFWRISQVVRQVFPEDHPASQFSTGNMETLEHVKREELMQWYREHYSANLMNLVVLSRQTVPQLEQWARQYFSPVEDRDLPEPSFPHDILPPSEKLRLLKVKTVEDKRLLTVRFPLPSQEHYLFTEPAHVVSFFIGHEGEGSLLALLKKQNLATSLSAGLADSNNSYSMFNVHITLTEKGFKQYRTVIRHLFQAIQILQQQGVERWRFEEQRDMTRVNYRFDEKPKRLYYAIQLASALHHFPLEWVHLHQHALINYAPKAYDNIVFRMRPENMLVILAAKEVETDQVEPYYGTHYSYEHHDTKFIQSLKRLKSDPDLFLPEANPFIPEDLELVEVKTDLLWNHQSQAGMMRQNIDPVLAEVLAWNTGKRWDSWKQVSAELARLPAVVREDAETVLRNHLAAVPEQLLNEDWGQLWFVQDVRFTTPKASIQLLLNTPEVYQSPRQAVLAQLYVDAIQHQLNKLSYNSYLAGLNFSLSVNKKGLVLTLSGYADKLPELLVRLASRLKTIEINQDTYNSIKAEKLRDYQNFEFQQPYQQAFYWRQVLMEEVKNTLEQYEQVIQSIRYQDLQAFASQVYDRVYLQGVAYGNLEAAEVQNAVGSFRQTLGFQSLPKDQVFEEQIIEFPQPASYWFEKKVNISNSAVVSTLMADRRDPSLKGAMLVISKRLQQRFFTELRTNQQLGYIVDAGVSETDDKLSWVFLVQSSQYAPDLIEQRIQEFIPLFIKEFEQIQSAELTTLKEAVINSLLEKPSSIDGEAGLLFDRAYDLEGDFEYTSKAIQAVENLSKADIMEVLQRTLAAGDQRKLTVHMVGSSHESVWNSGEKIESIPDFKANHLFK